MPFILLFIGFAIKLPAFPFHTWLPDAHVEAPDADLDDPGRRAAEDGRLRHHANLLSDSVPMGHSSPPGPWWRSASFSIIYGAFAAMAQTDFKRLVAYSSVSHMGYVLLGIGVWKINEQAGLAENAITGRWG